MDHADNNLWETNIENLMNMVSVQSGCEVVEFIFSKHGATGIDDLTPSKYSDVYDELDYYSREYMEGEE